VGDVGSAMCSKTSDRHRGQMGDGTPGRGSCQQVYPTFIRVLLTATL
jgi:hypothetical protein